MDSEASFNARPLLALSVSGRLVIIVHNDMEINKLEGSNLVKDFLNNLQHPLKPVILEVRKIILDSNQELTEHIKWNAPSFCFNGEDKVTMKLFPPKNIQVIFHRGVKVKQQPKDKLIQDNTGILKWSSNDRAVATFIDIEDVKLKSSKLSEIVIRWIEATKEKE